jgi:hypothetical protein
VVVGGVFGPDGGFKRGFGSTRPVHPALRPPEEIERDGWLPVGGLGLQSVAEIQPGRPAIQLDAKTILNRVQPFAGFVYREVRFAGKKGQEHIEVRIKPEATIRARCSASCKPCPGYDRLPKRR